MKIKAFFTVIIISSIICSCNKILDTTPQDFLTSDEYYNTESELESALAGVYDRLGDTRVYAQGMSSYLVFSDEFFMKGKTSGIEANAIDASTLEINRHWEALYTGIERANVLLESMAENGADVSEEKYNEIKGQALFLRAYYYFLLVDEFGSVPLKLTATQSPDDEPLGGSPIRTIYDQILKDMREAATLVKSVADYGYNTRISKTAVQGILARVCLTMAGYPLYDETMYKEAGNYADSVMQSGLHNLNADFKQIFINHSKETFDVQECLWEVELKGTNQSEILEAGRIGSYNGIACSNVDTGYGYDYVHATAKLYNAYESADTRRDWAIAPFRFVTSGTTVVRTAWSSSQLYQRSIGKWRREYETTLPRSQYYTATNWPLLRYADVLLMYAEAENAMNGPTEQAYEALNKVRRRAYAKDVNISDDTVDAPAGMSQQDFQDYIINERLRELAFEGLRKHDLIRWGIYVSTMQVQAQEYQANMPSDLKDPAVAQVQRITARSVVFPIPNSELATNTNLNQNAGW